jgi:hypothetical protein
MAIRVQGVQIAWGGVTVSEPVDVELDLQRGLPVGRSVVWTLDLGTITVLSNLNSALSMAEYGKRKILRIQYRDESNVLQTMWESDCIYQGVSVKGELNNVWQFAFTFKVMDTVGAGSFPV